MATIRVPRTTGAAATACVLMLFALVGRATAGEDAGRAGDATGEVAAEFANGATTAGSAEFDEDFGDFDQVEDLEAGQVEEVTPAQSDGALDMLGKLHPMLVHLPIGWLLLLLLVDLGAFGVRRPGWERVGLPLLAAVVVSFVPAIATGVVRYYTAGESLHGDGSAELHRNLMLATAACCVVALVVRWRRRTQLVGGARWGYLLLILAATGLMVVGGHLGAELVFGDNYLPF